jgi:NADPH-dependent glutamate synthase beta subunit-like oxidoreductase
MKHFSHFNASTVAHARKLLERYRGKALLNAGGTDLLSVLKDKVLPVYPELIINIKTVSGLSYVKQTEKGLKIGALTRLADIVKSSAIKKNYGLLWEAARSVATPHIRNMCTIGGNLAQHIRCWYYRYPHQIGGPIQCLRKGGKICNALAGDHRYHSIFGAAIPGSYPCSSHCPAETDIPAYMERLRNGDFVSAARLVLNYNPMPAITGRVCPIFCEPHCNRGELDQPVAIKCVERSLGDYMLERPEEFFVANKKSGNSVAIVGSGPAGLSAAFYLRRSGCEVTVFEKLPQPGGMLLYAIPQYRLPKDVVRKQIEALRHMGVKFQVGVDVQKDMVLAQLSARFDAVFIAAGTWRSLRLGVPGEDARRVYYALDYLSRINSGEAITLGREIIVIGGGSVAIDAARTARRLGSPIVHLVCLECRDLASKDRMLAEGDEIIAAEEEGIIIHNSLGIKEITTIDGDASGLLTMACLSVRDPDGSFNPQFDTSCIALSLNADSIIVAIGQVADRFLPEDFIACSEKGTIAVNQETLETSWKGVFAGGDFVSGPSTVIQAVESGRRAGGAIIRSFTRAHLEEAQSKTLLYTSPSFTAASRVQVPLTPVSERITSVDTEDIHGVNLEQAKGEAERCFNCGCIAVGPSDIGVALVALNAKIVTTKRMIDAQAFFTASALNSTVLDTDELITEIRIPKPPEGVKQSYIKFTVRKPIDFAIASVASIIEMDDGTIKNARLVLGAVAPAPLEAVAAEQMLKGRPINESVATEAAEVSVADAKPLSMNLYKVEITKALVRRAILGCLSGS